MRVILPSIDPNLLIFGEPKQQLGCLTTSTGSAATGRAHLLGVLQKITLTLYDALNRETPLF